ncbi:Hsp70 family protein [soil metagenome]
MQGRLAIDFGNANTVVAVWRDGEAKPVNLTPFSRLQIFQQDSIPVIPSLIHYRADGNTLIGNQVLEANLATHEHTFIALKTTFDTVHAVQVGKEKISARRAAEDFLAAIIAKASKECAIRKDEPIAFTVPVDAFEKYSRWLTDIASRAGHKNIRLIDEPAAAALSFGRTVKQNDDYLIFDFGAGSLDVAVVRFNFEAPDAKPHCKVLGKKSMQLGGNNVDTWLFNYFLANQKIEAGSNLAKNSKWLLLNECRAAKEILSFHDSADIAITDHESGKASALTLTRSQFVEVLEDNEFFAKIDRTISGAEATARYDYGYKRQKLAGVFMVGGTSIIPELQKQLKRTFGKELVEISHPLDSIASGACAYAAGASLFDHIQHDYAIEVRNIKAQKTQMKIVVRRGEKYPSVEPVASEIIKAVIYGQTKFQILIYEISKEEVEPGSEFIDLAQVVQKDDMVLRYVCLNKAQPTLLETKRAIMFDRPALQIDFRIDENKHLVIDTYRFDTDTLKVPHVKGIVVVRLV